MSRILSGPFYFAGHTGKICCCSAPRVRPLQVPGAFAFTSFGRFVRLVGNNVFYAPWHHLPVLCPFFFCAARFVNLPQCTGCVPVSSSHSRATLRLSFPFTYLPTVVPRLLLTLVCAAPVAHFQGPNRPFSMVLRHSISRSLVARLSPSNTVNGLLDAGGHALQRGVYSMSAFDRLPASSGNPSIVILSVPHVTLVLFVSSSTTTTSPTICAL